MAHVILNKLKCTSRCLKKCLKIYFRKFIITNTHTAEAKTISKSCNCFSLHFSIEY